MASWMAELLVRPAPSGAQCRPWARQTQRPVSELVTTHHHPPTRVEPRLPTHCELDDARCHGRDQDAFEARPPSKSPFPRSIGA